MKKAILATKVGMTQIFKPKFQRHFAELGKGFKDAVSAYCKAVKTVDFPNESESY